MLRVILVGGLFVLGVGCAQAAAPSFEEASARLSDVEDVEVTNDAGTISYLREDGAPQPLCAGDLIAPRIVLVPKECAERTDDEGLPVFQISKHVLSFSIGEHRSTVEGFESCLASGCNVAVFYLTRNLAAVETRAVDRTSLNGSEQAFVDAHLVDPCGIVDSYGQCEYDVAVRCTTASSDLERVEEAIIGGVDASSAALDAVGQLRITRPNGLTGGCTGTLISSELVLTAKHCVVDERARWFVDGHEQSVLAQGGTAEFRVGWQGLAPTKTVAIDTAYLCEADYGGAINLGCDVAVLHLVEPITDVTPMAVSSRPMPPALVDTRATAVGYGVQHSEPSATYPRTRKVGTMTIRALEGPERHTLFSSFDDYRSFLEDSEGPEWMSKYEAAARSLYDFPLLAAYEIAVGGRPGDSQACDGDSGGPLVVKEAAGPVIYGVGGSATGGVRSSCRFVGALYASFGPNATQMFDRAGYVFP